MMGVQTAEARLFYDFCLDDHVPFDHLLRSIDGHLDLDGLRQTLKPFYSWTVRMLIVGYWHGHSIRAAALRGGSPQPGVPVVLPTRSGWKSFTSEG
jgi:hypothetical protein